MNPPTSHTSRRRRLQDNLDLIDAMLAYLNGHRGLIVELLNDIATGVRPKRLGIQISDHALLRFMQRANVSGTYAEIVDQLLPNDLADEIAARGPGAYPHPKGGRLVVKEGCVVSYLSPGMVSEFDRPTGNPAPLSQPFTSIEEEK